MKKIFIYILIISTCIAGNVYAKTKNAESDSVKFLKELTEKGAIERLNDIPVEKADTTQDTIRVNTLKKLYKEEYDNLGINQENPEAIMNYRGTIE